MHQAANGFLTTVWLFLISISSHSFFGGRTSRLMIHHKPPSPTDSSPHRLQLDIILNSFGLALVSLGLVLGLASILASYMKY